MNRAVVFMLGALAVGITPVAINGQERPNVSIKFDKYHGYKEMKDLLDRLAATYPSLAKVYSIGKDYKDYDIWLIEITNQKTGRAEDKPAFYADGNMDNDEAASSELLLYTAQRVLTKYGGDPEITKLLDTTTLYFIPMVNPYMSDLFISTPMNDIVSSINARPRDDDGDGRLDEDPPEDIDGDGNILLMRVRDPKGRYKTNPNSPRLLVKCKPDEPGEWTVYTEGLDNDHDGLINEDWIGGTDLNRNFPFNWRPEWIQEGAGPFPLSEPESRTYADFIRAHPNIGFVVNGHAGPDDGLIYRVYGSLPDSAIPRQDYLTLNAFAEKFAAVSGGLKLVGNYGEQAEHRFGPGRMVYGYGLMKEWSYEMQGAFGFSTETGMLAGDYNKDGRVTEEELLRVSDEEFGGKLFVDWKIFKHPTLGNIEIGGFTKWTRPNPPPGRYLQKLVETYGTMYLYWASILPRLQISEPAIAAAPAGFKVTAVVENVGMLPSYVAYKSIENRHAKPVLVTITTSPNVEVYGGEPSLKVGHLSGLGFQFPSALSSGTDLERPEQSREVSWLVRLRGTGPAWVEITATTPKAGTVKRRVNLGSRTD